ncbi:type VI secretion lipoprotein TssJ [Oceanospirillum multiglobuliferum]|uniref:type VI secretion lipoprotein TssJ n=1 Tax=Oceanospirillum multiglobuliferum TaxID=64969 RepID=UPI001F46CE89|nr:type VI secretion lipoprotein TssJ [Oceanospirillum multiglobuliferum]
MWSARLTMLFVLFVLTGCTVCPPSNDLWSTDIADKPTQPVSAPKEKSLWEKLSEKKEEKSEQALNGSEQHTSNSNTSNNDLFDAWIWQDDAEKWLYTGRETPHAPAAQWVYEPKSIVVRLQSDELLNSYLGQPHTIMIKVLQLTDVAAISEFKGSAFGLSDLMSEKATTLSPSILKETRITIGPDQAVSTLIDREQGARYIALVAGYFDSDAKNSVRVMAIPSVKPRILPCYDSAPWPFGDPPPPTPDDVPARLKMWLTLDASAIGGLSVTAQ